MKKERVVIILILAICFLSVGMGIYFVISHISTPKYTNSMGLSSIPNEEGIAVVNIYGPIEMPSKNVAWSRYQDGSTYIVERLSKIKKDKRVKAVVIHINSPGGSVAATQEIYEQIKAVRKTGKKIVVSIGDIAASGGYYIATAADEIIANPGSLIGSIGVIMSIPSMEVLLTKIGVSIQTIKSGEYKDIGAINRKLTPAETKLLQEIIDNAYNQFFSAVLDGRKNLTKEELILLADGRIFIGNQALKYKLIDQLGTYDDSIKLAAQLSGIKGEPKIIREKRDPFESLLNLIDAKFNLQPLTLLQPSFESVRLEYRYRP